MLQWSDATFCQRFKVTPNYSVAYVQNITPTHNRSSRPRINKANGTLSKKSTKRIQQAVRWMLLFSKEKKVYSKEKKKPFRFRINFITLTLSTAQQHSDTFVLHRMLFPFLKYLERAHSVTAYVWRAEIQGKRLRERGERCIHFHITTDRFIHYAKIRKKWNALQLQHGYREPTADPNSTDVHSVRNTGSIISYMAKYISKAVKEGEEKVTCKIFGMSRNLSLMNCTLKEEETADFFTSVNHFIEHNCYGNLQTEHAKIYFNDLTMLEKYPELITMRLQELYNIYHKGIEVAHSYTLE